MPSALAVNTVPPAPTVKRSILLSADVNWLIVAIPDTVRPFAICPRIVVSPSRRVSPRTVNL